MKKRYTIISVAIILIMAIGAMFYTNPKVVTIPAEVATVEDKVSSLGFIVRDETMYYATTDGTPYYDAAEGERIPKDSRVAVIFEGDVNSDSIKQLSVIDTKLTRAKKAETEGLVHKSDTGSVENDIMNQVNDIYSYAEENNVRNVSMAHNAINAFRTTGEYSLDSETASLEDEKWQAIQNIGNGRKEIYTDLSGVFSTYLDGLESVLTPSRIEQYNPEYIRQLSDTQQEETSKTDVKTGDPICKVMNNHVWYTLIPLSGDEAKKCEKGSVVTLRFKNMANSEIDGTIDYISDADSNGDKLVMIKCSTYIESVFSYRRADVDVIFKSYTGYKVPVNAVRIDGNKKFVYGRAGNTNFACQVEDIYTDREGQYAIVESSEEAVNKLSKVSEIVLSDNVD